MSQFDIGAYVLIFEIETLITGRRREAHASRLKFYADGSLNANKQMLKHTTRHEIEVRWKGLSEAEASWEPADVLLQDVPVAVRAFVKKHHKQCKIRALRNALRIK
ncbi:Chromo (CHRromatin Organization MOdifier) domain [Phytophthora infestans]|uniref:Chromo (CHRromatin Organization MOdifier) domain n=1 Tax=Phytophthora infestans TaxID=4787 RepID=A0A8S9UAQ9_PHYIN|nr:Chromo (CHRromatin Organization MOdifier) domain [Phytophthora infestans]